MHTCTFLWFRRKRKGKGAKGKARNGGKTQKGTKLQAKSPLPSPTANSALSELPVPEENKSKETQNTDKPDGAPRTVTKGMKNTRKSSRGEKYVLTLHYLTQPADILTAMFLLFSYSS